MRHVCEHFRLDVRNTGDLVELEPAVAFLDHALAGEHLDAADPLARCAPPRELVGRIRMRSLDHGAQLDLVPGGKYRRRTGGHETTQRTRMIPVRMTRNHVADRLAEAL